MVEVEETAAKAVEEEVILVVVEKATVVLIDTRRACARNWDPTFMTVEQSHPLIS